MIKNFVLALVGYVVLVFIVMTFVMAFGNVTGATFLGPVALLVVLVAPAIVVVYVYRRHARRAQVLRSK